MSDAEMPDVEDYSTLAVVGSLGVAVVVTALVLWAVSGFGVSFEELFRVGPTIEGGGVGSDWETGNSIGWLEMLIKLTHAADVVMGVFILFMVFLHWASFRRLASRMRRSETRRDETAVADGGERE